MFRPNIVLPPVGTEIIEQITAAHEADPIALRATQLERAHTFNDGLSQLALVMADPSWRCMRRDTPDPTAMAHYALVFDVLNRQQAALQNVCLDTMLDEAREARLARTLADPNHPEAWISKRVMGEQEEDEKRNPRPIPPYDPSLCTGVTRELLSYDLEWQEAVAGHDPAMYAVIEGRVLPMGVEDESQKRMLRFGGVAVYALVNSLVAQKPTPA